MDIKSKLKRLKFKDIFQQNPDGSLTPRYVINVNGVTIGPGIAFSRGVNLAGVDFFNYRNNDIAVEEDKGGVYIVKGFYSK